MKVVPITQAQAAAAESLYGRLRIWGATDTVLRRLAKERPGAAFEDVMIKAEAINYYHGTRVARARMPVIAGQASFVPPFDRFRMAATPGRMAGSLSGGYWLGIGRYWFARLRSLGRGRPRMTLSGAWVGFVPIGGKVG